MTSSQRPPWKPPVPGFNDVATVGFGPHFYAPLGQWMQDHIKDVSAIGLLVRLTWPRSRYTNLDIAQFADALYCTNDATITAALDAVLYQLAQQDPIAVVELDDILELGGSAWRVRDDGCGLEQRVLEEVRQAVMGAIAGAHASAPDAATHLGNAWRAAYGINPDPRSAYREAVMAVESAAKPMVEPNNTKSTLGTVNGALRADPAKWLPAITGALAVPLNATPVLGMMETLWNGHTDRHGATPTTPVTLPAAQAAVHLAATLVQWWTAGGIAPK